jgi:chemotaxis protein CheY-P-specific phosphatase CheC
MSAPFARRTGSDVARLRALVETGAAGAAAALAELVGRSVFDHQTTAPQRDAAHEPDPRSTGVFFEAQGHLRGLVALLLAPVSCDTILNNLLRGRGEGEPGSENAASALCEVGNIVASRTMSAVADNLGARILLSTPKLVTENAEGELARWVAERRRRGAVLRLESLLADCDGAFEALLVFILDP